MERVRKAIPEEVSGLMRFTKPLPPQPDELLDNIIREIKEECARNGLPMEFKDDAVKVELRKREEGRGFGIEGLSLSTRARLFVEGFWRRFVETWAREFLEALREMVG